jgi:uncharacterized membrane protein
MRGYSSSSSYKWKVKEEFYTLQRNVFGDLDINVRKLNIRIFMIIYMIILIFFIHLRSLRGQSLYFVLSF